MSSNSIFVVKPYNDQGVWVFDDWSVGLVREPFVMGMPEIINALVVGIYSADKGFSLLFSSGKFPGYSLELTWLGQEFDGNWYVDTASGRKGWLCPALFLYFDGAPRKLYARAEGIKIK